MCCARCTKNNKCACSVKSSVSDYKDNSGDEDEHSVAGKDESMEVFNMK